MIRKLFPVNILTDPADTNRIQLVVDLKKMNPNMFGGVYLNY